ncbi:Pre-mRNA-splicing factor Cwc2/Slt11 like protein [Aduncisulcus paluster]|uniref:Pre-mRNA-splicing factor Cwc2/Slt11 like protein n=1 Tax=Aduncisulcus paluster TaxID=2918883 RepID=A0ABQ5KRF0_9EUKA|nr:Pre-mRNA-splicing factor Cwc2/Slt11 like protein [Aduncisulcus paluster]
MAQVNICSKCVGKHDTIEFNKEDLGSVCPRCGRQFDLFSFVKDDKMFPIETVLCFRCSFRMNCCQFCLSDLDYGIPLLIRSSDSKQFSKQMTKSLLSMETEALIMDKKEKRGTLMQDFKREQAGKMKEIFGSKGKKGVCLDWLRGICEKGKYCTKLHSLHSFSEVP